MVNLVKLRKEFPSPSPYLTGGSYCVGGAFSIAYGCRNPFPTVEELAADLRNTNHLLNLETSIKFATKVTNLNDHRKFTKAWQELENGTRYNG